jgi:hypothetical protein
LPRHVKVWCPARQRPTTFLSSSINQYGIQPVRPPPGHWYTRPFFLAASKTLTADVDAPPLSLRALQRPVGTSFLVHGGVAGAAWAVGALTDRVDAKDIAWAAAPVFNAWYQAIAIPVLYHGLPLDVAIRGLSWRQALLVRPAGRQCPVLRPLTRIRSSAA